MIHCHSCNATHPTPVIFCPNCGLQLIHVGVLGGDELVFSSQSGWKKKLLVRVNGVLKTAMLSATVTPNGLVLADSPGYDVTVSLLSLLQTLQGPAQVLEA